MIQENFKLSKDSEPVLPGDVIAVNQNGEARKTTEQIDTFKVIGICLESSSDIVSVGINGILSANTNDDLLEPGDFVVAEVDGTVKCKTAFEDDIDIIGMVVKKPENNKVLIKIK